MAVLLAGSDYSIQGWAKRSVPTIILHDWRWWARRKSAFAHPTKLRRVQCRKPSQKPLLGLGRGPWRQVILLHRRGQAGIPAEQAFGLGLRKAGKLSRLEIGRPPVGGLDRLRDFVRQVRRPPGGGVARRQQPLFPALVVAAQPRLERRDRVGADIFRRVMQQCSEPEAGIDARRLLA